MTLEETFWSHVEKSDGCWDWRGSNGWYGRFTYRPLGRLRAHRVAYTIQHLVEPGSLLVCHHCDNPSCVRGDHLFLGTNKDNMQDAKRKGRINNTLGMKHTAESKEKIRLASIGRAHTPESKEKLRLAFLGKKRPVEDCEKMRLSHLGKKLSPEHLAARTKGQTGLKRSPETIERMRLARQQRRLNAT